MECFRKEEIMGSFPVAKGCSMYDIHMYVYGIETGYEYMYVHIYTYMYMHMNNYEYTVLMPRCMYMRTRMCTYLTEWNK